MNVGTSDMSFSLMRGQSAFFRRVGFEVSVVSAPGPKLYETAQVEGVQAYAVPMDRQIGGFKDFVSLLALWRLMRRVRPVITNVGTPKAGMLGGLASYLTRVPCRVYTLRGLRCEGLRGWKRRTLILAERISCACAHRVICVSPSLREQALKLSIADAKKLVVLASGSSNGVDAERFAPTIERLAEAALLRSRLNIPVEARVVGFVGRLTRDKGISLLVDAYLELRRQFDGLRLLLVGDFEKGDQVPERIRRTIVEESEIICTGMVADTAAYYHLMDVVALPTYREGFPNAVLEAQAAMKPVVTTEATGARDSVQDGVSGILVPVGDVCALTSALSRLLGDTRMRQQMGHCGQEHVRVSFNQDRVWKALEHEFLALLKKKGFSLPQVPASAASRARNPA
jgi:glycosyltransferase involved in cell wall biosynthesis